MGNRRERSRISLQARGTRLILAVGLVAVVVILAKIEGAVAPPAHGVHEQPYLYVANGGGTGVSVFAIRSNGSLEGEVGPFAADGGPSAIAVSPDGRHLYTANLGPSSRRHDYGDISGFSIDPDGLLTELPRSPFSVGGILSGLAITPGGEYLYTTNGYGIWPFIVQSDGSLKRLHRLPGVAGVPGSGITVTPDGKYLYAIDLGDEGGVWGFAVDGEGALTRLAGSPFPGKGASWPGIMAIIPNGRNLYVGETNDIQAYSIAANGALDSVATYAVAPPGGYLYVADSGSNTISVFRIGLGGSLTQIRGSPFSAPRSPDALAIATVAEHAGQSTRAAPPLSPRADCRADPLAGVYHPWRLHVNRPCITVLGIVARVRTEPDHDWHINLRLPPGSRQLVDAGNRRWEHGNLVVEVIPMDQRDIPRPSVGRHITVTGAYVLDTDHGWEEIHPAWIIDGHGRVHYTAREARESVTTGITGNERHFGHRRNHG